MAGVEKKEDAVRGAFEVGVGKSAKLGALFLSPMGKSIARQVDKKKVVLLVKVNRFCFAWSRRYFGQMAVVPQMVDEGRFADVRPTNKGELKTVVHLFWKLLGGVGGGDQFHGRYRMRLRLPACSKWKWRVREGRSGEIRSGHSMRVIPPCRYSSNPCRRNSVVFFIR